MNKYTKEDFTVMPQLEHIRTNPGMYIGNTHNSVHLVEEVLDNALDEATAGYADIIAIIIDTQEKSCAVLDNGRGIPIDGNVVETISTELFSGSKFQTNNNKSKAYKDKIICGLHGIGLVAVNSLSTEYKIEIYRDEKYATFEFKNSKLVNKEIVTFKGDKPFSTKIYFKPDPEIFEDILPDIDRIKQRVLASSAELSGVTFALIIDGKREVIKINQADFFKSACISNVDKEVTDLINIRCNKGVESLEIIFCYSINGPIGHKILSSVNLLPVESGGTHVNMFINLIRDYFAEKARLKKIRILPSDCLCGLRAFIMVKLLKVEFSGQTKEKLINRKTYFDIFFRTLQQAMDTYFKKNPVHLDDILNHIAIYRQRIDAKNINNNPGRRRLSTKFTKLRPCSRRGGELFIAEGESAGGGLIACREPEHHAVLPLKGKIPSVLTNKYILKNKEVSELIQALGTGIGELFDISFINYDKIIIATDADPDGGHIASLLTMIFAILMPEIIKKGYLYKAVTPLYGAMSGKSFIPIWTEETLEKARSKYKRITRFKGLGELNTNQLKYVMMDESTRKLYQIQYTEDLEKISELFTNTSAKLILLEGRWECHVD